MAHVRATCQCHQGVVAASTDDGWGLRPDATRAKTSRFPPRRRAERPRFPSRRRSRRTRCSVRDRYTRVKKSHWPQLADAAGATHTRRRAEQPRFPSRRRSRRTRCSVRDLYTRVKKSHWPQLADAAGATHTRRRAKRFPSVPLRRKRRGNTAAHACDLILSLVTISHGIKKKDPLKENSSRGHFYIHYGFKISGLSRVEGV